MSTSQISVLLKETPGDVQACFVTGNEILRIPKSKGLDPDLPKDLYPVNEIIVIRKGRVKMLNSV